MKELCPELSAFPTTSRDHWYVVAQTAVGFVR
jgi:hypothetical protein